MPVKQCYSIAHIDSYVETDFCYPICTTSIPNRSFQVVFVLLHKRHQKLIPLGPFGHKWLGAGKITYYYYKNKPLPIPQNGIKSHLLSISCYYQSITSINLLALSKLLTSSQLFIFKLTHMTNPRKLQQG